MRHIPGLTYSLPTCPPDEVDLDHPTIQSEVADMAGEYDAVLAYLDSGDADNAITAIGGVSVLAALLTRSGDELTLAHEEASNALTVYMQQDDDLCRDALERVVMRGRMDAEEAAA